jgi:hypothetical protein
VVSNGGVKMKAALGLALIVGIIAGLIIGYSYSVITLNQESWHSVTSFVLATSNESMPDFFITAYSAPDVYHVVGPYFAVTGNFWRVRVETAPYYNYSMAGESHIIYYSQAPMNNIRMWKDAAYTNNPYDSMSMLVPDYDYNATTSGTSQVNDQNFYMAWLEQYIPVRTVHNCAGPGNYTMTLEMGIGCFNFTIEEYR